MNRRDSNFGEIGRPFHEFDRNRALSTLKNLTIKIIGVKQRKFC